MSCRPIAVVMLLGSLTAGCATDTEPDARLVPDEDVPFGLLDEVDTPPPTANGDAAQQSTVYLVNEDDLLVPVVRTTPRRDPGDVVALLDGDLTAAEVDLGLRTLLDDDGDAELVVDVVVGRGIATIDLAAAFLELDGETQVLALAQLVLTLTSLPGIGQVAITTSGAPADVPRADGTTTSDPVAAADYSELIAP
jgi:spore germination protein GerM